MEHEIYKQDKPPECLAQQMTDSYQMSEIIDVII